MIYMIIKRMNGTLKNKAMKTRLLIVLTAFTAIGTFCAGQELPPERGANGKWGYIDTTGKEIVPCNYDDVGVFYDGLARETMPKR